MGKNLSLFDDNSVDTEASTKRTGYRPLADQLRPTTWQQFIAEQPNLSNLIQQLTSGVSKVPPSLILWGPPGSGKTTFAHLLGKSFPVHFVPFSAVLGGVKEVREIVAAATARTKPTLLFVDELHRFSRSQQDAFLPHIEAGTIIFVGATTENPSFYLTGALLSRTRVVQFAGLSEKGMRTLIKSGGESIGLALHPEAEEYLLSLAQGDARVLLNMLEQLNAFKKEGETLSLQSAEKILGSGSGRYYDRTGEEHYNLASAFIKSLRGSDPDAALYWGFRMLEGGEDPRFLIRRMMIFASEDVGNADPRALQLAVATGEAFDRVGLPEGRIPIAQCIIYLASVPKSNSSYAAMNRVLEAIEKNPRAPTPLHLRNAPTKLMKDVGYGEGYQYPHDHEGGHVAAQYLPDELKGQVFYEPKEVGLEKEIRARLQKLRAVVTRPSGSLPKE